MIKQCLLIVFLSFHVIGSAQTVWGTNNSRTEFRDNAGLQGSQGALSGFYQTAVPASNYPTSATGWWHLLDIRHSNPENNYAMQFAGSFFDQKLWFRKTNNNPAGSWSRVLLETDGKVGIGTDNPGGKLEVADGYGDPTKYGTLQIVRPASPSDNNFHLSFIRQGNTVSGIGYVNNSNLFGIWCAGTNQGIPLLSFSTDQRVGIGTTEPGPYKLAVEGTIGARKIRVQVGPFADYVFEKNYPLPSLQEVEQFIQRYKHLPEVPSAKEVEANGLDLGDNQVVLLKKIEELTLYVIEQNKRLEQQNKKIEEQGQKIKRLEQRTK